MGQKVNPIGLRVGINRTWDSKWFAEKNYREWLHEDLRVREFIKKELYSAGISRVELERAPGKLKVTIHTARPGIVIGKGGAGVEELKKKVEKLSKSNVFINIVEVRKPETDAQLIAESVALQLEKRIAFRRAMKKAISQALKFGVKGIKVNLAGRLGGAEMSRVERYHEGRVPLHTLRADIDFGYTQAHTTYGVIGVKVWVYKGEIFEEKQSIRRMLY
ncbi:MAG: 30S ribosomal protein S3 [Myxococcales bacterium]|nr:MAG: 30S ribosomal protein S3 [Myxococcales bacterium]